LVVHIQFGKRNTYEETMETLLPTFTVKITKHL